MRNAPPLVPTHNEAGTVYLVLDDFEQLGKAYREADERTSDAQSVIRDLTYGEFHKPVRVVAFNIAEGWSRDASAEIAKAIADAAEAQNRPLSRATVEFLERYLGEDAIPHFNAI
jgi:hypothetical protein